MKVHCQDWWWWSPQMRTGEKMSRFIQARHPLQTAGNCQRLLLIPIGIFNKVKVNACLNNATKIRLNAVIAYSKYDLIPIEMIRNCFSYGTILFWIWHPKHPKEKLSFFMAFSWSWMITTYRKKKQTKQAEYPSFALVLMFSADVFSLLPFVMIFKKYQLACGLWGCFLCQTYKYRKEKNTLGI